MRNSRTQVVPATTTASPTAIPVFPTISDADVQRIAQTVAPMIAQALMGQHATPAPVVEATPAPRKGKKGRKAAPVSVPTPAETVEIVTYRKDHSGEVKQATRAQFENRKVLASNIGHTLTEIRSELVVKGGTSAPRTQPANATPAPVVAATTPPAMTKAQRKEANRRLADDLRRAGVQVTPEVWAVAKAQAGLA